MTHLTSGIEQLLRSIWSDEGHHGGLLFYDTIRRADELRAFLAAKRAWQGLPERAEPVLPRRPRGAL